MIKELLKKLINFDTMITPTIIKFIYFTFTALTLMYGLSTLISGVTARYGGGFKVVIGLIIVFIAPFITRIWCEFMMVMFKINDSLTSIKNDL